MPLGVGRPSVAVSLSGEQIVYVAAVGESKQLFLRTNDASPPRPLPGTEGAHSPFFSPDEKSIAFFADGKLRGTLYPVLGEFETFERRLQHQLSSCRYRSDS